jgi:putative transposase
LLFNDDDSRAVLMRLLIDWRKETGVRIAAFVLMGNHFHLVGETPTSTALSRFMGNACSEFSRFLNVRSGRKGTNWQGRFYAAPLDLPHTLASIRYVERNPVAANLVASAWDWRWSSAAFRCGAGPQPELINCDYRPLDTTPASWRRTLQDPLDARLVTRLREGTFTGDPIGSDDWVADINKRLGREARRPRGRPRKS